MSDFEVEISTKVFVCLSGFFLTISLEFSDNGWPFILIPSSFVHPNGALLTTIVSGTSP